MNICHICGTRFEENRLVKCKLCCDGLEQDACAKCAKAYENFRAARNERERCRFFNVLKQARMRCIRNERKTNGHAAEK